jgi:coenzyme F420-0:L-glutamate ligase / coenzyme F420-1:gamma-L-glutamate ligase
MELIGITTDILRRGDNLAATLKGAADIHPDDIVVISSKIIATCEDAFVDLATINVSDTARMEAEKTGRSPEFCQTVLDETTRMHGRVAGRCPGALLCVLHPTPTVTILAANAGMDQSNVPDGTALGWPRDSAASAKRLASELGCAVIIIDSCCTVLRTGISAYALACAGIDPIRDERGKPDLFGKPLRITRDAIADELAAGTSVIMGNAAQATPAVIVRNHGLPRSNFAGWIETFRPEEDLFRDVLRL